MDADSAWPGRGILGDIYLFRTTPDSAGNSYGCHENYLVGRQGEFFRLAEVLIPFLVSRQLICGRARSCRPRGATFTVSQRAEHVWESVSSARPRQPADHQHRDEPHADAERFRRLHVIVGDSNMSKPPPCSRSAPPIWFCEDARGRAPMRT